MLIAQDWLSIYIAYIVVNVENFCISTIPISFLMDLSWIDKFRKDGSVERIEVQGFKGNKKMSKRGSKVRKGKEKGGKNHTK